MNNEQKFEEWWSSTPILKENKRTIAEKAWKAALESIVVDLPASISFGHDWLMNSKDVEDAIHATGARTK